MGLPFVNRQSRKRDQVVAIDLGGQITKAVHVQRKGDRLNLANFAMLESPAGDKAMSADVLAEHLRNVGKALGGGRPRQVTLALGVNDTLFRQIEAPLMPVVDLRQMLKFSAKTYLQQDLPNYVYDCYYAPPGAASKPGESGKTAGGVPKCKVMVGGIKRDTLNLLHSAIRSAGWQADQVVPGAMGPTNAFEHAEPDAFAAESVALVDVGFRHTTITILDQGDIILHRVVAIGGDRLTGGLSEAMKISYLEAENIKIGMANEVQAELGPLIQPLGRELRASMDFFEHQRDKAIGTVYLSGGTARNEVLLQMMQAELMVQCKSWNPAKNLQLALPPERLGEMDQAAPQLTVAIGAATAAL